MQCDILLTKQNNNGYIARPVLMPEIVVSGVDEEDALKRVSEAIVEIYSQSQIVRIDVPLSEEVNDDPWLRFGGIWGDDDDWTQLQKDIDAFRHDIEQQETQNGAGQ